MSPLALYDLSGIASTSTVISERNLICTETRSAKFSTSAFGYQVFGSFNYYISIWLNFVYSGTSSVHHNAASMTKSILKDSTGQSILQ